MQPSLSPEPEEDRSLHTGKLLDAMASDPEVRSAVVERFHPRLLRTCRTLLGNKDHPHLTAEDLAQATWERALRRGALGDFQYRGSGSLEKWLATLAKNLLRDSWRRSETEKRRGDLKVSSIDETAAQGRMRERIPSTHSTPTANVRHQELVELCRRHLDDRQWRIWKLMEIEGLSSVEVARRLGTTDATIRGILLRARKKLLCALKDL